MNGCCNPQLMQLPALGTHIRLDHWALTTCQCPTLITKQYVRSTFRHSRRIQITEVRVQGHPTSGLYEDVYFGE